ncbi:MAG TPA: GspH/FimT family pseudopilin [Candidatus Acidoferrales bacterium]|nr:GspH/FimT family pseudopilin [Candidatus Acidoferrales bacterium]
MLGSGRKYQGFTLIEILVVLAVLTILAAIALPGWGELLPGLRLNSAARQIQSELHRLKAGAVAANTDLQLVFASRQYSIERKNDTLWEPTGETRHLPEGIDIRSTTVPRLGFTPRGTALPGTGGTVRLCNVYGAGRNVVVSSTGRIRLCRPGRCDESC